MNNSLITFDTNCYRVLVENLSEVELGIAIDKLLEIEKKSNIEAVYNPIVLLELFSHLADVSDPSYNICKSSIGLSYSHCKFINDKGLEDFRILMDSEFQLCQLLFGIQSEDHLKDTTNLGKCAYAIYKDSSEDNINEYRDFYQSVNSYMEDEEKKFVDNMFKYVVKSFDPNCTNWQPLKDDKTLRKTFLDYIKTEPFENTIAVSQVQKAIDICQIKNVTANMLVEYSKVVRETFSASIILFREIIKRILETGMDFSNKKRKRWNYYWDFHILFSVTSQKIHGKPLILVTSDEDMLQACIDAGFEDKAKSLKEYLSSIKFDEKLLEKIISRRR